MRTTIAENVIAKARAIVQDPENHSQIRVEWAQFITRTNRPVHSVRDHSFVPLSRAFATLVLDAVKDGEPVPERQISAALRATGDL